MNLSIQSTIRTVFSQEGISNSIPPLFNKIVGVAFVAFGALALCYYLYSRCFNYQDIQEAKGDAKKVLKEIKVVQEELPSPKPLPSQQEPISQQLQVQQVCYTQLPENDKLVKIARLYANAFAGPPWNEYKVCQNGHYFGRQQSELTSCTNCSQPLKIAYPQEETADYITKEVTKSEGTLITFEDERGEVFAAGWGYVCTTEELQAKYNSSEMKEKVVDRIKKTAEKVFYLSEIMVETAMRKRGIATKITKCLFERAQSLNLKLVMRTRSDSPMAQIANNMQMSQVIGLGEDKENLNRVLYIKI